ncbi:unnamed protein product [Bathycoccus prasinos]
MLKKIAIFTFLGASSLSVSFAVKFGQDFTDTLHKKPEPLKGPEYSLDDEGTGLFADDMQQAFAHGLKCGSCFAVLNETKAMLTDIVDEAGGEAELMREEMLEKLLEKVDEEDLCDQIGDLYGVKYEDGLTLAKAWEALVTASTLKEKVAKMDLDDKGVVLEKGDIGKHAVSVLADAKADIDFGLHGRDTVVKLEQGEAERFDPKRLAYHIFKQHEIEDKDLSETDKESIRERILTHPWSSKRQKMVLGMQCEAMVKSATFKDLVKLFMIDEEHHWQSCAGTGACKWKGGIKKGDKMVNEHEEL